MSKDTPLDARIFLAIPATLKQKLEERAIEANTDFNSYVRVALGIIAEKGLDLGNPDIPKLIQALEKLVVVFILLPLLSYV